jgi:hypothetical protein
MCHMSMTPAPRHWPRQAWSVNSGMPTSSVRNRNWTMKVAATYKHKLPVPGSNTNITTQGPCPWFKH